MSKKASKKKSTELKAKLKKLKKQLKADQSKKLKAQKALKAQIEECQNYVSSLQAELKTKRVKVKKDKKAIAKLKDKLNPSRVKRRKAKKRAEKSATTSLSKLKATKPAASVVTPIIEKTQVLKSLARKVDAKKSLARKASTRKSSAKRPLVRKPLGKSPLTVVEPAAPTIPSTSDKVAAPVAKAVKSTNTRKSSGSSKRKTSRPDNLKRVEGIGVKIEQLLKADGIDTFKKLSKASFDTLRGILDKAGPRFRMHKPDTWAEQAGIAAKGDWDTLKQLQVELKGGLRK